MAAGLAAAISSGFLGLRIFPPSFYVALFHAFLIGLPLYLVARSQGRPPWWLALVGGFIVGAVPTTLLGLSDAGNASVDGVATVVNGVRTPAGWLTICF